MPQSLANILVHLVFSTKDRRPMIVDAAREQLHAYMLGVLSNLKCPSICLNSVRDHVHVCLNLHRTVAIADVVEELKTSTSKWMKQTERLFQWQAGYGAFSIGQSQVATVKKYIANQEKRHTRVSFQDEFRELLKRYELEYDEKYVWD
jgi:REP element-mobilizing transposase RayT